VRLTDAQLREFAVAVGTAGPGKLQTHLALPGHFVTGQLVVEDVEVSLLISKAALQTIEDRPAVFVETAEGFKPQPVTLGRSNETVIEVTAGVEPGQRYASSGAFTLKAQLSKGAFGGGHGH
jgi:cobalt-zinc-cadmium efflux system membrane fusion protein